ncbi:excisionase family DNA binding protein [Bradyrhizobium niftali]|uniref:helix-turn-helix domain-containing protein n=1 Tax=Bradyrhizobium niftali TaxID=2560055 RepID=UPI00383440B4
MRQPEQAAPAEYFTTTEAARYLRLSVQFLEVARHRGDGRGPPFVKLSRSVRYRRSALDAWMAAQEKLPDRAEQPKAKSAPAVDAA